MLCRWHTETLVANGVPKVRPLDGDLDDDLPPVRRVLDGVVDEVRQDLACLVRVGGDQRRLLRRLDRELDSRRYVVTCGFHHAACDRDTVALLDRGRHRSGFEPTRPEEVVDDPCE